MTWGPFLPGLDAAERKARARCTRLALKLLTGDRGKDAAFALLRLEISGGDESLIGEAEIAFERLSALNRRRVMSGYQNVA